MELISPRDSCPHRHAEQPAHIDLCRGCLCVDLKINAMMARSLWPPAASEAHGFFTKAQLTHCLSLPSVEPASWVATCVVVQVLCSGHGLCLMLLSCHHLEILNNCNF